jgi:hypothetical protein
MMLDNIDRHSEQIVALDAKIAEAAIGPFARQVAQLDEITGVGRTTAQELIAEVGVDMGRFACGLCWPSMPIITTSIVPTAPWGRRHRSGPPNHPSSCRRRGSCDEIDSVG